MANLTKLEQIFELLKEIESDDPNTIFPALEKLNIELTKLSDESFFYSIFSIRIENELAIIEILTAFYKYINRLAESNDLATNPLIEDYLKHLNTIKEITNLVSERSYSRAIPRSTTVQLEKSFQEILSIKNNFKNFPSFLESPDLIMALINILRIE